MTTEKYKQMIRGLVPYDLKRGVFTPVSYGTPRREGKPNKDTSISYGNPKNDYGSSNISINSDIPQHNKTSVKIFNLKFTKRLGVITKTLTKQHKTPTTRVYTTHLKIQLPRDSTKIMGRSKKEDYSICVYCPVDNFPQETKVKIRFRRVRVIKRKKTFLEKLGGIFRR